MALSTPIIKAGKKAVGASGTTVTVTFANDDQLAATPAAFPSGYTVFVAATPCWATSVRVSTAPGTTSFILTFGTACGTAGDYVYWMAVGA